MVFRSRPHLGEVRAERSHVKALLDVPDGDLITMAPANANNRVLQC